ncbi:unnamed protein product, partial [Didymodactylos carnosus]
MPKDAFEILFLLLFCVDEVKNYRVSKSKKIREEKKKAKTAGEVKMNQVLLKHLRDKTFPMVETTTMTSN